MRMFEVTLEVYETEERETIKEFFLVAGESYSKAMMTIEDMYSKMPIISISLVEVEQPYFIDQDILSYWQEKINKKE